MANPIETLKRSWTDVADKDLDVVGLQLETLEKWLYRSYEPDKFGDGNFNQRLVKWLENVTNDADKKTLFRLLPNLFYVGPIEFEELYRCAYQGPIARWLIDAENIDICALDAQVKLAEAAKKTWFCPVSDSFRINAFFHINNLATGASLRPDWRSMHKLSDVSKLKAYCNDAGITRLVLLEDFVGGGSQAIEAVSFAATHNQDLQVLFVPLIICPDGADRLKKLEKKLCASHKNSLKYEAVMELPEKCFFTETQSPFDQNVQYTNDLRSLITSTYPQVSGAVPPSPDNKPYHPFGFPHDKPTGGMVVMYSNTPDNTLPIVHWRPKSKSWNPIFPRHSRD
jgi:hypothetical protein